MKRETIDQIQKRRRSGDNHHKEAQTYLEGGDAIEAAAAALLAIDRRLDGFIYSFLQDSIERVEEDEAENATD